LDYAENGKIGLEKFEKKKNYDLILLDLQMPIMDGFQLANILRNEKKSEISILALTANNSELEKVKCLDIGMNGYLTKPFKQKDLFESIINILSQKENSLEEKALTKFLKDKVEFELQIKNTNDLYEIKTEIIKNKKKSDPYCFNLNSSFKSKEKNDKMIKSNKNNIGGFRNDFIGHKKIQENLPSYKNTNNIITKRKFKEDIFMFDTCENSEICTYKLYNKCKRISKNTKNINGYEESKRNKNNSKFKKKICFSEGSIIEKEIKKRLEKTGIDKYYIKNNCHNFKTNNLIFECQGEIMSKNNHRSYNWFSDQKKSEIKFLTESFTKITENPQIEDSNFDTFSDCSSIYNNENNSFDNKKSTIKNKIKNEIIKNPKSKNESKEKKRKNIQIFRTKSFNNKYVRNSRSNFLSSSNSLKNYINTCNNCNKAKECEVILLDFENEELYDLFTEEDIKNISVNFDALKEITGDDYFMEKDLINIFLEEFPKKIQSLKEALQTNDLKTIQIISHALKSNVAIFGIEVLRNKFLTLEQAVKNIFKENKILQALKRNSNILDNVFIKLKNDFLEKYIDL
jgi:CheY-like chemotaxis protein